MRSDAELHQVALSVSNVAEAVAFYGEVLGLELMLHIETGHPLAFFSFGNSRLMLEESDAEQVGVIYLWFNDLGSKLADFKAKGIEVTQDAAVIFDDTKGIFGDAGQKEMLAFIKDPSGNQIGLMSRE